MVASRVPSREETTASHVISLGEAWQPTGPQPSRLPECQSFSLSREDLRLELRAFAEETLQADLLRLQQAIRGDVEQVVLEIRQALQTAHAAQCDRVYETPSEHEAPTGPPDSIGTFARDPRYSGLTVDVPKDEAGTPLNLSRCPTPTRITSAISNNMGHLMANAQGSSGPPTPRDSHTNSPVSPLCRSVSQASLRGSSAPRSLSTHTWKKSEGSTKPLRRSTGTHALMAIWQQKLLRLVNHQVFDTLVALCIFAHGVFIGMQAQHMSQKSSEEPNPVYQVSEAVFCVLFTIELTARLLAYRCDFFLNSDRGWNIFEFIIVLLQLVEMLMFLVVSRVGITFNLLALRFMRLVRVVRLARALRLIRELRVLVSCIAASVKPLLWSCILLFMVAYVAGVAITQLVQTKRIQMITDGREVPADLDMYWETLFMATWTLIQSLTGGVDWNDVARPLMNHVSLEAVIVFTAYILFTHLAMLNVVTGVFIDSVMQHGRQEKELCTRRHVQALFDSLDVNHEGEITWEEFSTHLQTSEMNEFFKTVDVDIEHAKELFELLDLQDSGALGVREFMDGCLKIWTPARGLDLRMIMRDISRVQQTVIDNQTIIRDMFISGVKDTAAFADLGTSLMHMGYNDKLPAA